VYKRDDSPYYWAAYKKNGKRVRESTGAKTKTLAMEVLRRRESDALLNGHTASIKKISIEKYMNEYLKWVGANLRPYTKRSYSTITSTFIFFRA